VLNVGNSSAGSATLVTVTLTVEGEGGSAGAT